MLKFILSTLLLVTTSAPFAQQPIAEPTPIAMPSDRAADSYAIYSQLLPSDAIEWGNVPRAAWLLEDRTVTPTDDPRQAIEAPKERKADLQALFDDYDAHKAEIITLYSSGFNTQLPVRLADKDAQARYIAIRGGVTLSQAHEFASHKHDFDIFIGVAGMHSFSQVFFNADHSLAMVHFGISCGTTCGNWTWVVLQRKDGNWAMLPWVHSFSVS